jgi:hypothetical protein
MKKPVFIVLVLMISSAGIFATQEAAPWSERIVQYKIEAKLDTTAKAIAGDETLTWRNTSDVPVAELRFHLYLNAFQNNRSTFMKESGGSHRGFEAGADQWGSIDVKKIAIKDGADLTTAVEFIQPDDQNKDDRTVMRVALPEPVAPGGSITLDIAFRSKLPQVFARSGYKGDFYMVGQWFPKIGVWENGAWNCHQYHASSEFYADFGVFDVDITVPKAYVIGATGKRVRERKNGDGTVTYTHVQEDVHDFAWTACPDFVEIHKPFTLDDPPVRTEMIFLVHKTHLMLKDRYEESLRHGLEFYSKSYGAYPYPTITLVDPPINALGAGGMEYPTLFTSMGSRFFPKGVRMPEMVTIHEFGHGYWYGMVASNEFEEAWLDEGINSYSEIKAMDRYYGAGRSMVDLGPVKIGDLAYARASSVGVSRLDPIMTKSWEFFNGGSYAANVYQKAAVTLLTLEGYLGEDVMGRVMKTYFERWKFRHPRSEDFFAVAEEVSGRDLDWFFDQFFKSPDKLDYAVSALNSVEIKAPEGKFNPAGTGDAAKAENGAEDKNKGPKAAATKIYDNEVVVIRNAELVFPQEILVVFEDGKEVRETWDGKDRWKRFKYTGPSKLKMARLDPEGKIPLDANQMNNSRLAAPDKAPLRRHALGVLLAFQKLLSFVAF